MPRPAPPIPDPVILSDALSAWDRTLAARSTALTVLYGESILGPSIRCGHDGGGLELDGA